MTDWPLLTWLVENLIWASAAMLLVLAIRHPVAHWFGAGVAYALWLVPALRLIAPPAEWIGQFFQTPMPSLPPLLIHIGVGGEAAPLPLNGAGQWVPILLALWASGAILFLGVQGLAYRRFLARLSRSMRGIGTHRGVELVESPAADGPLALGLWRRRIVVPEGFQARYAPAERQLALDHERYHHARGDILANHIALIVLAATWFNPISWIGFRAFRADQELSCDAAIAAEGSADMRCHYARALVKSASRPGLIAACPLNRADQLKRRLKMLNHHRKDRRRLWAGSSITFSLVAASMMLGTPGQAQDRAQGRAEPKEQRRVTIIERSTGENLKPGERREFRLRPGETGDVIYRGFTPEMQARLSKCPEAREHIANPEARSEGSTKIILCGENGPMNDVNSLQRARERISRELTGERRDRILGEIDAAIARARKP